MLGALLALALLATTGAGCQRPSPPETTAAKAATEGRPAHLSLPRIGGGGRISLAALRGTPVVVFLFTTWSLRSQLEAPQFAQMHERERGVRLVGVALDRGSRVGLLVKTYVDYVGFTFDVGLAQPNDLELVSAFGRTVRVPRTLLLDQAGVVVQDHQGQTDFPRLQAGIRRLLRPAR